MTSDLFIEKDQEKLCVGKIIKVNDDGTIEVETSLEKIIKLFQLCPDLLEKFIQNQRMNKNT